MSDYAIEKTTVTAQPVLSQRFQVTPEQLGSKLAEVLPAIFGYASSGAATIVGQPFSRYHAMGPKLDVEAGIPVAAAAESRGEIVSAELPGDASEPAVAWRDDTFVVAWVHGDPLDGRIHLAHLTPTAPQ